MDVDREEKSSKGVLISCILVALALLPCKASSWGPATHTYVASELVQGQIEESGLYGAVLPDFLNLARETPDGESLIVQLHRDFRKLTSNARNRGLNEFAFGFMSHNERWGADYIAHRRLRAPRRPYVIRKSLALEPVLRPTLTAHLKGGNIPFASWLARQISPELSHVLIEAAVDLMVRRNEYPAIGFQILQSAEGRPESIPNLLVAVYGKRVARLIGRSLEDAAEWIRGAEGDFREQMIAFGQALTFEEPEAIAELGVQGAAAVNRAIHAATGLPVKITAPFISEWIAAAVGQVKDDYASEVSATLSYLKRRPAISQGIQEILARSRR